MKFEITLSVVLVVVIWYANGLRIDNIEKNKQIQELKKYKCSWEDFNKSFIPSTALPRLPETEEFFKE